jgi:iron(III) transport system permease protein
MKELPATLLLGPTGFNTLATRIWSWTVEAFFAQAAPYALMLVLVSSLSVAILLSQEEFEG